MKKQHFGILYALMLIVFTAYVLADTFLITRVYGPAVSETGTTVHDNTKPHSERVESTEKDTQRGDTNSYEDENISVVLRQYRRQETEIYVAEVKLSSAEYLKTALADNAYGRNLKEKTSSMARQHNAILAINGDFYGARERGYVLRNGVLYRETASEEQEDLVIYKDGSFEVIRESEITAGELLDKGAQQILSFGPGLITHGEISVTAEDEVGKAKSSNPRTAIGVIDPLHYFFVVSDGRTEESEGLSLLELAEFMQELGAKTAYNLDGGGSSTMVFLGEIINNPTTGGRESKERSVSDIVYIG